MRSSRSAFSTAAALRSVFIKPIEHTSALKLAAPRPGVLHASAPYKLACLHSQQRNYAAPTPTKRRLPQDDEITAFAVRIVSEDGKLSEPQQTNQLLQSIDRRTETLITVAEAPRSSSGQLELPICKIMSKQALREAEKARSKRKADPAATLKTIELNWAIDKNDLSHRLDKMKQFLSKGWRIDVVMAAKRKGRKATIEEAEELLKMIRRSIAEIQGAREWKAMEGKAGAQATIFAQGKVNVPGNGEQLADPAE